MLLEKLHQNAPVQMDIFFAFRNPLSHIVNFRARTNSSPGSTIPFWDRRRIPEGSKYNIRHIPAVLTCPWRIVTAACAIAAARTAWMRLGSLEPKHLIVMVMKV